jgi:tRNA-Thr(GGU) m(6)t(6)A37 methyltransferase TsaA
VRKDASLGEGGAFGLGSIVLSPIGVVRSPFVEKMQAPRQPYAARGVTGTIELARGHGFEHAVMDLTEWDHLWVLFVFHLNEGWRPKVLPPRSKEKRGVFATRSPHRPNPIGLSVVRLCSVEGLVLHVSDLDIVDGSPVLDVKPYVPYADAVPTAKTGWLEPLAGDGARPAEEATDPEPGFEVRFDERAREQAAWLEREHGVLLGDPVAKALSLGPEPHPYRRIRREADGTSRIAYKSWRARFVVEGRVVRVLEIASGYRPRELASPRHGEPEEVSIHRAFAARFEAP